MERKIFSIKKKDKLQGNLIGIIGTGAGVGVTHLSVWMSNYLCGICRRKTALLEWSGKDVLRQMGEICKGGRKETYYRLLGVDYYCQATKKELAACLNGKYHTIIIDFGDNYDEMWTEFLGCGRKFLLTSLSEWQLSGLMEFEKQKGKKEMYGCTVLTVFGSEESRREVMKNLKVPVLRIPFSMDPFTITGEDILFFQSIM